VSTKFEFTISDGTHVELDCDERFMKMARDKIGLLDNEIVTVEHVKFIFMESLKGAAKG
jgi:hypothetical protein